MIRFLLTISILAISLLPTRLEAQEDYPILTEENLDWKLLPSDLTRKVVPLGDPSDLRFKLGTIADGQQFLRIQPPRLSDLSFGVKSSEADGSYIASSDRAIYWPRQHLLRLESDVIVSSTHCDLKGETFDIHLHHDTIRLEDPKEIFIDDVALPIVSQGIRVSGLGHPRTPDFEWDPVDERNARPADTTPVPTTVPVVTIEPEAPPPSPKQYSLHIGERWELTFEGKKIELDKLEEEILRIGKEEPESSILVEQSAAANPVQVSKIQQTLQASGIKKVKTTLIPSGIAQGELNAEVEPNPMNSESSLPALSEKGGRLLWVYEPGRYNLNGKDYTEPALRQALRAYAREYSDLTLVIASSMTLPSDFLRELIRDIKAYGFHKILVAMEPTGTPR